MKFYDREKEIEILRRNWEKSAKHSLFTVMIGRRRIGKTLLLLKTEQEQKMLYLYVSKDNERVLAEKFQKIAEEERVTLVGNYWDRKGTNEIDLIALNDIDKTALVAEVKRNADRYNPKLLQEKFESIRSNFGKYNEVQLIGLSMQDM